MAAMWATDGRKHTYLSRPSSRSISLYVSLRAMVNCGSGMLQLYNVSSFHSPPQDDLEVPPPPQGDAGHIQYLIPAVLS